MCISTVKFLAHLVNQHVLYELVALELLTLLLDEPTDDSVEVAVGFIKVNQASRCLQNNTVITLQYKALKCHRNVSIEGFVSTS